MNESEFWRIIDLIDSNAAPNVELMISPAVDALARYDEEQIREFQNLLAEKLFRLDGEAWAYEIGERAYTGDKNSFDGENFLGARCCVIANGRDFYSSVLRSAKYMPKDQVFPQILDLAKLAYEQKTAGKPFEFKPLFKYATFSNRWAWNKLTYMALLGPGYFALPVIVSLLGGLGIGVFTSSLFIPNSGVWKMKEEFWIGMIGLWAAFLTFLMLWHLRRAKRRFVLTPRTWTRLILGGFFSGLILSTATMIYTIWSKE